MSKDKNPMRVKITAQIYKDEKCFGPGVALLLEKVEEKSSLRSAAADIKMSYSKAWTIIRRAEKELGFALLDSKIGGKSGGGATLTEEAKKLLCDFRTYERELNDFAKEKFVECLGWID